MLASSKHKYSKTLAFPDTYYELIINVLQSVELFCAYDEYIDNKDNTINIKYENILRDKLIFKYGINYNEDKFINAQNQIDKQLQYIMGSNTDDIVKNKTHKFARH